MAVLKINTYGDPILRKVAKPINRITPEISVLIGDMIETMYDAPGVGLAAPQIGQSIRLVIITLGLEIKHPEPKALINPEIVSHGEMKELCQEGCLSVPEENGDVPRWTEITVRALDENGEQIEFDARNMTARIIQHEIDHLNGILFIDRLAILKQDIIKRRLKKRLKKENAAA
jgi:peptide deformylase